MDNHTFFIVYKTQNWLKKLQPLLDSIMSQRFVPLAGIHFIVTDITNTANVPRMATIDTNEKKSNTNENVSVTYNIEFQKGGHCWLCNEQYSTKTVVLCPICGRKYHKECLHREKWPNMHWTCSHCY